MLYPVYPVFCRNRQDSPLSQITALGKKCFRCGHFAPAMKKDQAGEFTLQFLLPEKVQTENAGIRLVVYFFCLYDLGVQGLCNTFCKEGEHNQNKRDSSHDILI